MIEADDFSAAVKRGEADLVAEQKAVEADQRKMLTENAELKAAAERMAAERAALVTAIDKRLLAVYEGVAKKRNGIAVAEARDGVCGICHVRLRPQVFNTVLRNEQILQCDAATGSCTTRRKRPPRPTPSPSAHSDPPRRCNAETARSAEFLC